MIVNACGLYDGFLMGRGHSWKEVVLKQCAGTRVSTQLQILGLVSNDKELQQEAACAMYQVLIDAFFRSEQRNEIQTHVDRNVSHHMSLTAWRLSDDC